LVGCYGRLDAREGRAPYHQCEEIRDVGGGVGTAFKLRMQQLGVPVLTSDDREASLRMSATANS
jgi:hypothetical protein